MIMKLKGYAADESLLLWCNGKTNKKLARCVIERDFQMPF